MRRLLTLCALLLAACGDNERLEPPPACEPVTFTPAAGGEVCPDERHTMTVEVRGDTATVVCSCPDGLESERAEPWSSGVSAGEDSQ